MKDKILLIVTILLVIGIAVAVFFFIDLSNKNDELTKNNKQLENDIDKTEEELGDSQDEIEGLETDKSALIEETTTLSSDLEAMISERDDVSASVDTLQTSFDGLSDFTYCSSSYSSLSVSSSDYKNIDNLVNAVIAWYEDNIGDVIYNDYFPFWSFDGSPIWLSIQNEDEEFHDFMFYFEDDYGYSDGIFFVSEQCWVNGGP